MFSINFKYCKVFFKPLEKRFVTKIKKKMKKNCFNFKVAEVLSEQAGKFNRRSSNKNSNNKPKI